MQFGFMQSFNVSEFAFEQKHLGELECFIVSFKWIVSND
jgi:hypothetical protein